MATAEPAAEGVTPVVDAQHAVPFATTGQYQSAVETVRRAAAAYYAGGDLTRDDGAYDALLARVAATETAHPQWIVTDSPTTLVGAGVTGGDVPHATPMLSLDNVFDTKGLRGWVARLERTLGRASDGFTVEPKIDGMAVPARYRDGRLSQVVTRGDGRAGEDVTAQARHVAGLPAQLTGPVTIEVRGEVFMTEADFVTANELRISHGGQAFANPRNATAGTLRAQERAYTAPLSFYAYGLQDEPGSHAAALERLAALGVATTANSPAGLTRCASADEIVAAVETLGGKRGHFGFDIDGVVVKADSAVDRDQAGASSRAPRWAIAYKLPPDTRTTTLRGIEVQIGRTGVITPVAVLDPVQVSGVTVTSATLHNFDDLVRRDVRIGDTVHVRRAGDVIPEITGADLSARPADAVPFTPPQACPRCAGEIDRSQKRWRCVQGRACGAAESIGYFTARGSMDIEGLGETIIRGLVARKLVVDPADLHDLDVATLEQLDRLGPASATKLVAAISASKAQPLARVLTGLGVRMTGRSMSRRLARHFGTMQALLDASVEQLQQVEGVGPERAATIAAELVDLAPVVAKLAARGVNMTEPGVTGRDPGSGTADTDASSLPLRKPDGTAMTVVVTGSVPGLTRTEGNEAVEALGGKPSGSVSAKTDLVVVGDGAGSKEAKARDLGIRILPAEQFAALLAAHTSGEGDTVTRILATW